MNQSTTIKQSKKEHLSVMIDFHVKVAMCKASQEEIENLVKEGEISPEEAIEKEIESLTSFSHEVICRVYNVDYPSEAIPYIRDYYHTNYID